jgi:hypothetical protein
MDQGVLVEMQVDEGKRLIERLVEKGVPVTAACWLKETEDGQWFLYLATPLVDDEGATLAAYRRVNAVIRQMESHPFRIDPLEIKVVAPGSAVGKAVSDLSRQLPHPSAIRYRGTHFAGMSIEGAYVYPLPAAAEKRG